MVQNNALGITCEGTWLEDTPHPTRQKALASIFQGYGTFKDCIYKIDRDSKWFRHPSNLNPGVSFQDLGTPFNYLWDGELNVTGGIRV